MKRSIIVFLLAFLATIGVGTGLYFLAPQLGLLPPAGSSATPAEIVPAVPAVAEESTPTPEPAPAPLPVEDPTPLEEPAPVTEPAPIAEPAPEPATEPVAEPTPAPTLPTPAETPRNASHGVALTATEVLKGGNVEEMLEHMVSQGLMSAEAAASLKTWSASHKVGSLEEVGSTTAADGTKTTRYRIICAEGKGDMLLGVRSSKDGSACVVEATEAPSDRTTLTATSDPLAVAEGFLAAVKKGDMATARGMVTGDDVSDATIAGLCMLFDEGAFALRAGDPIRGTFANPGRAGYLVYLTDPNHPQDTRPRHIGLVMQSADTTWRVAEVSLDALLSAYEEQGFAEGGRYFPIVKNPKGGDSLALFFDFNASELTPRSMRQLHIVAELLKQSQGKLNISGHTDDVGSEKYNLALSERRAAAVKDALVAYGVSAEQITTHGLGKSQPRRTYNTDDSEKEIDYIRGENRRAEIYLDFES